MDINRKRFLCIAASGGAGVLLHACGGGGYGGGSGTPASACGSTVGPPIHGHAVTIAVPDLASTTAKTYDITGTADHGHSITLTPTQLAQLQSGVAVTVTSTAGGVDGHTHTVATSCAIY